MPNNGAGVKECILDARIKGVKGEKIISIDAMEKGEKIISIDAMVKGEKIISIDAMVKGEKDHQCRRCDEW